MSFHEIISQIHKEHLEGKVILYLLQWIVDYNNRLVMENCDKRSSLDLIKKFNDAKWHIDILGELVKDRKTSWI